MEQKTPSRTAKCRFSQSHMVKQSSNEPLLDKASSDLTNKPLWVSTDETKRRLQNILKTKNVAKLDNIHDIVGLSPSIK